MSNPEPKTPLWELERHEQLGFLRAVQSMSWTGAVDLIVSAYPRLDAEVRLASLDALRFILNRSHRAWLLKIVDTEKDPNIRWLAFEICCHLPVTTGHDVKWLLQRMNDASEDLDLRFSALIGLTELLSFSVCKSPRTRRVIEEALRGIDPPLQDRVKGLFAWSMEEWLEREGARRILKGRSPGLQPIDGGPTES